jgi:PAP2 superfamily
VEKLFNSCDFNRFIRISFLFQLLENRTRILVEVITFERFNLPIFIMRELLIRTMLFGALVAGCGSPTNKEWRQEADNAEFLHRTIKQVTDVIVHDIFSPPVASRIYAYTSISAYEAAIQGNPKFLSLAGQVHGLEPVPKPQEGVEYCFPLAAVQAAVTVGKALVFSEDKMNDFYSTLMNEFRATGMPEDIFQRSVDYGSKVAKHIIAWADKDNYKQTRSFPKYTVDDNPATWKPTPPAYMDGIEPHWNEIRTMVLDSPSQFAPTPPTAFSTQRDSKFYDEAVDVYKTGKELSEEQKAIARFWDCNPFMMNVKGHVMFATKKISPGGHWMNITHVVCMMQHKSLTESAEAYAKVSIALMDGFISAWDEKYRSNLVRPETYINQQIDEDWTPLLQTPPFPEYTSAHSVISRAAAVVLTDMFGKTFNFTDSTELEFGMKPRSFNSFMDASSEAAISRLYGGIHYRKACEIGKVEGGGVGNLVVERIKTRDESLAKAQ